MFFLLISSCEKEKRTADGTGNSILETEWRLETPGLGCVLGRHGS